VNKSGKKKKKNKMIEMGSKFEMILSKESRKE
jgi:hypothetical protein